MSEIKKTNAARFLDTLKIPYTLSSYEVNEEDLSAVHAAEKLGVSVDVVFKTLVARADTKQIIVACIPSHAEIDLKALAKVANVKRCELIAVKELLGITGYIRGGCSPFAMKKHFPTFIDSSALTHERVYVSAGVRGVQLVLKPEHLIQASKAHVESLTKG